MIFDWIFGPALPIIGAIMLRFPYLLSVYTNLKLQKSSKVVNCCGCISSVIVTPTVLRHSILEVQRNLYKILFFMLVPVIESLWKINN